MQFAVKSKWLHPKESNARAYPAMEIRRNNVIVAFGMKWLLFATERICNCEMMTKHMTCSLKNPWRCPGVLCSNHAQTNYALFSLSASIRFHLPLWAGVDISGGEREAVTSGPLFSEIPRVYPLRVLHLVFSWPFPVIDRIYFEMTKHKLVIMSKKSVIMSKKSRS